MEIPPLFCRALKETKDRWALLVPQARVVNQDRRALLDAMEALAHKVSWAHLVLVVVLVSPVKPVLQVLLVRLGLPVHLASLWVTTLLLWLQFWDRVRPRYGFRPKELIMGNSHVFFKLGPRPDGR